MFALAKDSETHRLDEKDADALLTFDCSCPLNTTQDSLSQVVHNFHFREPDVAFNGTILHMYRVPASLIVITPHLSSTGNRVSSSFNDTVHKKHFLNIISVVRMHRPVEICFMHTARQRNHLLQVRDANFAALREVHTTAGESYAVERIEKSGCVTVSRWQCRHLKVLSTSYFRVLDR